MCPLFAPDTLFFCITLNQTENSIYYMLRKYSSSEIKLEQMQITLATFEQQNQVKNKVEQKKSKKNKHKP